MARVVLLGASNLTRGLPTALAAVRATLGRGPLEFFIAAGHGRSYGQRSWVLSRSLPGIVECGLWRALAARPPAPTFALLTDVGNDVAYGASVDTIINWVETCLTRLARCEARVAMTALPLPSLARLPRWQLELISRFFYPTRRQSVTELQRRAVALDARLCAVASAAGVAWVPSDPAWFGFDPIHIRRRRTTQAWRCFVSTWGMPASQPATPWLGRVAALRLRWQAPEHRWFFGFAQQQSQPVTSLPEGGALFMY